MSDFVDGYSDLHFAAREGDLAQVQALVSNGADLNSFDLIGKTPLHYAAMEGHMDVVSCLLQAGADPNAHDVSQIGNTPLSEIAGNCSLAMAQLLIKYRANPTIRGWMQLNALDRAKPRKRGDGPAVYALLSEQARKLGHHVE